MVIIRRTAAALAALGLLAGCASQAPAPLPVAGQIQSNSTARTVLGSQPYSGRVLYVGNIDGQPGLGNILVYTASMKNPQLIRTISNGTGRPFGMWVDAKNILYVANFPNKDPGSVTEFKPGASSPFFTITNFVGWPEAVAVDAHGNVYVNESLEDTGYVQVFPPGSNNAKYTINTGIGGYAFEAGGLAFDPKGNLIAGESFDLKLAIVKIAPGSTHAKQLNLDLTNFAGPGLGVDKSGNLYVGGTAGSVGVFPPGQTEPSRTISPVGAYGYMNVTPDGAVYVSGYPDTVYEIAPGASSPTHTFNCTCGTLGVAVSR